LGYVSSHKIRIAREVASDPCLLNLLRGISRGGIRKVLLDQILRIRGIAPYCISDALILNLIECNEYHCKLTELGYEVLKLAEELSK